MSQITNGYRLYHSRLAKIRYIAFFKNFLIFFFLATVVIKHNALTCFKDSKVFIKIQYCQQTVFNFEKNPITVYRLTPHDIVSRNGELYGRVHTRHLFDVVCLSGLSQ